MAYKLRSQDLKDATAGTTSAAIKAGGEERKEMRQIRKGLRDVRRDMKSVDFDVALDAGDQASINKYMASQSRKEQLTKRKADIKDWSTKKRVNVGARKDVNLMDKPIQAVSKEGKSLYEAGYDSDRATVSGIKSGSKAAETQGTGGLRYQNMFDAKGEYMYSQVSANPGKTDRSRTPKDPDSPEKWKINRGNRKFKISKSPGKGRYNAQKGHKGKGKRTRGYVGKSGGNLGGRFNWRGKNA